MKRLYVLPAGRPAHVIVDLGHRDKTLENDLRVIDDRTVVGMRRSDAWVWESDVAEHHLRTVLRYRPLSALYELRNLQGDEHLSFATRDSALRALGRIIAMPIVLREELDLNDEYLVRVQAKLDVEALPLPMRPAAYLSRDWSIASETWEWQLKP